MRCSVAGAAIFYDLGRYCAVGIKVLVLRIVVGAL